MYLINKRSMTALVLFSLLSLQAYAADWSALVKETMPSIVVLHGYDAKGELFTSATGFSIGENRIVTCWHAIDDANVVRVIATTKAGKKHNITHLLSHSAALDLAVMKHDGDAIPALELATKEADQGSSAIVIGSPREYEFSVTDGTISSWRKNESESGRREVQFTAPVSPGNSGGPLFNKDGEVLGVISWIRVDRGSQNLNFAVGYSHVKEVIKEADENKEPAFFLDRLKGVEPKKPFGDKAGNKNQGYAPDYAELAVRYIFQAEIYRIETLAEIVESQRILGDKQRAVTNRNERKEISDSLRRLGRFKADLKRGKFKKSIAPELAAADDIGVLQQPSEGDLYIFAIIDEDELIACTRMLTRKGSYDYMQPFILSGIDTQGLEELTKLNTSGYYECIKVSRRITYRGEIENIPNLFQIDSDKLDAAISEISEENREIIEQRARDFLRENHDG